MPRLTIADTNKAFDDELGLLYQERTARENDIDQLNLQIAILDGRIATLEAMRQRLMPEGTTDDE